jgi:hypothetical protein
MKHKINIEEEAVRNTIVIIETDSDIEEILSVTDSQRHESAEDYICELKEMGVNIVEVTESDFDIQEVECDDLYNAE